MSNLDEFTINYKVDANAAVGVLEKFNKKVAETNKGLDETGKGLSDFASGAANELSRLVPQMNEVATAVKAIGSGFTAASLGLLAFAAATKSAAFARDFFNAQRVDARAAGVGGLGLYDMQRRYMRGGTVTRESASANMANSQNLLNEYRTSNGMSERSKVLGILGVNPSGMNNRDFTNTIATKFAGMDAAKAMAFGERLGFTKDAVSAMRRPDFNKTALNQQDIDTYKQGESATADLNEKLAAFNEQMTKLGVALGGEFLPKFTKFVSGVTESITGNKEQQESAHRFDLFNKNLEEVTKGKGFADIWRDRDSDHAKAEKMTNDQLAKEKQNTDKQTKSVDAQIEADSANNEAMQDFNAKLMQAVQAFATGVDSFTGVIDERHAWAIWAGEAGRAGGLGGGKAASMTGGTGSVSYDQSRAAAVMAGTSQYDPIFEAAAKKYGVDANTLRAIMTVESRGNPNATSDKGARGLMQVMPSNFKATGVTDPTDPTQNIMAGAQIWAYALKRANGDKELALRYYNGGFDRSKWGAQNAAYPGLVMAAENMTGPRATALDPNARSPVSFSNPNIVRMGGGYSFAQTRLRGVRERLAAGLGAPIDQITQGGYQAADANVVLGNDYVKMVQDRLSITNGLGAPGLDPMSRNALEKKLSDVDIGLHNLTEYGYQAESGGQSGPRQLTLGAPINVTNNFNIDAGAHSPMELSKAIDDHLAVSLHGVVNSATDMVKQ